MSEINFIADLPSSHFPKRRKKNTFVELLKFLGIFALIFVVLSLIVMGPTLYTKFTYNPDSTSEQGLPANLGQDEAEDLAAYVDPNDANRPDSIVIPKINVDAPLIFPDKGDNVSILNAIKDGVALYPDTALPGRNGNSFVTGHSSYYWWNGGKYNSVFALLDKLETGDLIYAYYKGAKYVYRVNGSKVVNPSQIEVLEYGDKPIMSLMTCTPLGTNLRRLIVTADLIGSPPVGGADFSPFQQIPKMPTILPLY